MNNRVSVIEKILDIFIPLRAVKRKLLENNKKLEAFLRTVPIEYCGWGKKTIEAVSPGFCLALGIEKIEEIEDIESVIDTGDAAALEGLFNRLKQYGENFEINITVPSTGKTLKLFGKNGAIGSSEDIFSVIWMYDITDFAQAAACSMDTVAQIEKRESELRSAVNAMPSPFWIRNENLDLTWCNKSYSRIIDDSPASVIAEQKELPIKESNKDNLTPRVLAQKAAAKNEALSLRGHTIVDGKRRLIEVHEIPIPAENKFVGIGLDITKEEEWQDSFNILTSSYHEAMEQLRTAIGVFSADTKLEFYNSAYEQLTGMSGSWLDKNPKMSEIINKMRELRKLPEQSDYKQYKKTWENRFISLIEPHEEMQYLPDGTVVRTIIVPRPMGGLLITMEDVTSHLRLETSYNTLMAVQQETMDNLSEAIAVFGEDGRLKLSNQSFRDMWKMTVEDLSKSPHISKMIEKMDKLFDKDSYIEMGRTILKNALERESRKGRIQKRDNKIIEYSVVPLPDGNILNAYYDITDTVKVEEALHEKNAALEEAERLKTDFLANVSYQLRTPLNAILGFAEMLHEQYFGKLNDRQLEYTSNMMEAGQRLTSLINDILDLSSIEAGHLKLYPSAINVRDLMKMVAELTEEWGRKQRLEIKIDCENKNLVIFADERRLKQVLLNLISNAFNYSPNGGNVTLFASGDKKNITFGVKDTGIGIPQEDMKRIFTPFDKIRSKRIKRRSGAGLGLTLVKNIIELHGGSISIESKEDIGTIVSCKLPL